MGTAPTRLDELLNATDGTSVDTLMPVVYQELKRIARHHRRASEATLSTTELVHEAYFKFARGNARWEGRSHFFGAASHAMRQVLVDFARRRGAEKRGRDFELVSLGDSDAAVQVELDEILALDEALQKLDEVDSRLRRIVELRFFAGVSQSAVADMLGVSERTVERDWLKARLVLLDVLDRS